MIEGASKRFVVIVDESKWVEKFGGSKMAVPVEVIQFGWELTMMRLRRLFERKLGFDVRLRMDGDEFFVTDNLNYVIDLFFEEGIDGDLREVTHEILIVEVVEHGMFLGMATEVIVVGKGGFVVRTKDEILTRQRRKGNNGEHHVACLQFLACREAWTVKSRWTNYNSEASSLFHFTCALLVMMISFSAYTFL